MTAHPLKGGRRCGANPANDDHGPAGGAGGAMPLPALLDLAKLLARQEARRILAANDNGAPR